MLALVLLLIKISMKYSILKCDNMKPLKFNQVFQF